MLRSLLSGGGLMDTPILLGTKRIRKWGHSHVVSLPAEVREVLGVKMGDSITFRKVGRYVLIAVVRALGVAPLSEKEIQQSREALGV